MNLKYYVTVFSLCLFFGHSYAKFVDIISVAQKLNLTTLLSFIAKANLTSTLQDNDYKKVYKSFEATSTTFQSEISRCLLQIIQYLIKLPKAEVDKLNTNSTYLAFVLKNHVVNKNLPSFLLSDNKILTTLNNKTQIRINLHDKQNICTANGGVLVVPNNVAKNGIVHVVDKVLLPTTQNAYELISSSTNLSSLLLAVTKAGIQPALEADGPLTLFAPSNVAFQKLPPGVYTNITSNVTKLEALLEYHVVKGVKYSAGLKNGTISTMHKDKLNVTVTLDGRAMINGANVTTADLSVVNGVIHFIDGVLIPPNKTVPHQHWFPRKKSKDYKSLK